MRKFTLFVMLIALVAISAVNAQVAVNKDGSSPSTGTIFDVKSSATTKEHVVVQDATGYFGIGTDNPQSRLDVWGTIRGSIDISNYFELSAAPILSGPLAGSLEGYISVAGPATQRFSFIFNNGAVNDTMLSMIPSTGNIGIGTTLPVGKLHVSASTLDVTAGRASIGLETEGFQSWLGMAMENYSLGGGDAEPFIGYGPVTESFRIIHFDATPGSTGAEMRMVFMPQGPVGIGDPSTHTIPAAALQISNRNDIYPILNLLDNDVPVMTVIDGGNVGIGTTLPPTEKLEVNGTVKVSQEVNRPAQGSTDLIPVAYGSIRADGTIVSGSGNFTCTYSGTYTNYEITITGETYSNDDYTTVVTPVNAGSPVVRIPVTRQTSSSGHLLVYIWNLSGNRVQSDFSFIVYKP